MHTSVIITVSLLLLYTITFVVAVVVVSPAEVVKAAGR